MASGIRCAKILGCLQPAGCAALGRERWAWSWQARSFMGMPGRKSSRKVMLFEKLKRKSKVRSFDNLLQKEKPLRRLLLLKNALARHPNKAMRAIDLGRQLDAAGLMHRTKALTLLERYPCIFKLSENPTLSNGAFVQFTRDAQSLVEEEAKLDRWYEPFLVDKVTKLLMMSSDRMLYLDHLLLLERELGLPHDFRRRIVYEYPHRFKVVEREDGAYLELTEWDGSLAFTTRELNQMHHPVHDRNQRCLPAGFRLFYPKGHRQGLKHTQAMDKWQTCLFASPYETLEGVNPMSLQYDKRAVAMVHEFLSLTLEKLSSVEVLDLLRKHYQIPCRLLYFLHKHFGIFYVTNRGNRHAVFLKEAYRARDDPKQVAHLIEKGPHMEINERFEKLMEARIKRIPGLARSED